MKTTNHTSIVERLGRNLGRGWRAYAGGERRVSGWLVSKGVPVAGATALLWAVKLAALGTLFYAVFWLALLLVLLMFVAHGHDVDDWAMPEPEPEAEWRHGHAGFGLYTRDEYRIDQHDPSDPDS